jgi:hypothetical protein
MKAMDSISEATAFWRAHNDAHLEFLPPLPTFRD